MIIRMNVYVPHIFEGICFYTLLSDAHEPRNKLSCTYMNVSRISIMRRLSTNNAFYYSIGGFTFRARTPSACPGAILPKPTAQIKKLLKIHQTADGSRLVYNQCTNNGVCCTRSVDKEGPR
jgi:hypothetical protein